MTYKICYWDSDAGEQRERDTTEEETLEIDARKAIAPTDDDLRKASIQTQIDFLERNAMLNRGSRELELRLMENEAISLASSRGVTVDEVLASIPYYGKLKSLDITITALRAQL